MTSQPTPPFVPAGDDDPVLDENSLADPAVDVDADDDRPLDTDIDPDRIDSADADARAATEGTVGTGDEV